ncbi:zinc finger protein rotund isoform X3 [Lingula anatina]|uniref:Zinc finger protein rotund isoform X3 n=1 Tax=Lingula anatina TaxID=7574 RepID=A0A1S3JZX9_LINAN|nr:zinc finger protein rotund isoform X3 [Lingula anatina]|eukprot:XP_013415857.1 zinc finger protein rotund isoform X3 [Lingula anatina]
MGLTSLHDQGSMKFEGFSPDCFWFENLNQDILFPPRQFTSGVASVPQTPSPESHHSSPINKSPTTPLSPNQLVVPQPVKPKAASGKSYQCKMCEQMFESKSDMLVHCQRVHKQDPKPYKCNTCGKSFANSSYLSQHNRIHAGIKPYKCEICERRFTQLSHLQQHMRTHTGEKPYKCSHNGCGKAFTQLANLQQHSRSHMTDKPFRCNSCYKCYSSEEELREHIPKHSDTKHLKTHICNVCGKSYTQETYLARHMTKHALNNNNNNNNGPNKPAPTPNNDLSPVESNHSSSNTKTYTNHQFGNNNHHEIKQNGDLSGGKYSMHHNNNNNNPYDKLRLQIKQEDLSCLYPGEDLRKPKMSNYDMNMLDTMCMYLGSKSPPGQRSPPTPNHHGGSPPAAVTKTSSSAFMSFSQPNSTMMSPTLPSNLSNFPFLPSNTLNHPSSPHLSSITSQRYFPYEPISFRKDHVNMDKTLPSSREGAMIANSLLSLQHIKNYSSHQMYAQGVPHGGMN